MKKSIAFLFAALLVLGGAATAPALADPLSSNPPSPKLVCSDGNSDVSLHFRVFNQGPGTVPAGSTILYSYRTSKYGPMKNGKYKIDAPIPQGEYRIFPYHLRRTGAPPSNSVLPRSSL